MPARSQPSCINKRLLCPSLASTLRNPILPKAVTKRKYVGLNEPHFDEDVEKKRPDAGREYDPDGDYIYDARKYFNPEKYRELIANQEEKKKKQQEHEKKFYYRAFPSHKRHCYNRYTNDSGYSSVHYVHVSRERSSSLASVFNLDCATYDADTDTLPTNTSPSSNHYKKKSKHSRDHSHSLEKSHKHAKRKKSDGDSKKHKKKRKHKKSTDRCDMSACHFEYQGKSNDKHRKKLHHKLRHRSKTFSLRESRARTTDFEGPYGYQSLDQNHVGNDSSCSPNLHRSPYVVPDSVENVDNDEDSSSYYAERRAVSSDAHDVLTEDSSFSSEYSDLHEDVSPRY